MMRKMMYSLLNGVNFRLVFDHRMLNISIAQKKHSQRALSIVDTDGGDEDDNEDDVQPKRSEFSTLSFDFFMLNISIAKRKRATLGNPTDVDSDGLLGEIFLWQPRGTPTRTPEKLTTTSGWAATGRHTYL